MDGCPDKGEQVPIRMYMNGVQLTPSYKNIHNRLSVKYSINLVLVDEEDRKYFKQTEIIIYRKPIWSYVRKDWCLDYYIDKLSSFEATRFRFCHGWRGSGATFTLELSLMS